MAGESASDSVVGLLDAAVQRTVLVFGALPPQGRDVDLLARPEEEHALAVALDAAGFAQRGNVWARFARCSVDAVEVVPAATWGLPAEELEQLFADAEPLGGCAHLAAPSPAHTLLIRARKAVRGRGEIDAKARSRVDAALARDPAAWEGAHARAAAWGATRALALFHAAYAGTPMSRRDRAAAISEELVAGGLAPAAARRRALRAVLPRTDSGALVSFSGLDGAGKSSQSAALHETLERLGWEVEVVWSPLGGNPILDFVGKPAKRALTRMRFGPFKGLAESAAAGSVMSRPDGETAASGGRGALVRDAWATLVAALDAASQRSRAVRHTARGRVVVFDRHALDSIVRLRFLYGSTAAYPLQRRLVDLLAPRADFAYYLDIAPETSLARKDDIWSLAQLRRHAELYREELARLGVRRLDGERPKDELCAEIALEVWLALAS